MMSMNVTQVKMVVDRLEMKKSYICTHTRVAEKSEEAED